MTKPELLENINKLDRMALKGLTNTDYINFKKIIVKEMRKESIGISLLTGEFVKISNCNKSKLIKLNDIYQAAYNKIFWGI